MENLSKAINYAIKCHDGTNHLYDSKSYTIHLAMVYSYGLKYIYLMDDKDGVLEACWLHDVIEDCRQTYNDVKNKCGEDVAEIVYALTNEKGRNRKERANDRYYEGIRSDERFQFVKLCDRLANMRYSKESGSSMASLYSVELPDFVEKVCGDRLEWFSPMVEELLLIAAES